VLLALGVIVAVLTFIAEAIALGIQANVSPLRVLQSTFDFDSDMIRPGWLVLGAGLTVVTLDFVCARFVVRLLRRPPMRREDEDGVDGPRCQWDLVLGHLVDSPALAGIGLCVLKSREPYRQTIPRLPSWPCTGRVRGALHVYSSE
jgi:hypothetical protein